MINLGDKVRDKVSGFTGTCVAVTNWIDGCVRITVQPPIKKDGTLPEAISFDDGGIEVLKAAQVKLAKDKPTGGPCPEPKQQASVR